MNYNNQKNYRLHSRRSSGDIFGNIFRNSPTYNSRRLSLNSSDDYPRNSPVMMNNQSQSFVNPSQHINHPPQPSQQPIMLQQNHQSMSSYNLKSTITSSANQMPPNIPEDYIPYNQNQAIDHQNIVPHSGRLSSRRSSAPDIRKIKKEEPLEASKVPAQERISLLEKEVSKLRRQLRDKSAALQKWQSLIRDDGSMLSLFEACRVGEMDVVEFLFEQGVNVQSADRTNGMTPLMVAAENGQVQLLEYILNQPRVQADHLNQSSHSLELNKNKTALMHACRSGQIESVHALLLKGANVDHISDEGLTPLIVSAKNGHIDIMELLISSKADINLYSKKKKLGTALMQAIASREISSIEFLLRAGADAMNSIEPNFPINEIHMLCRVAFDRSTKDMVNKLVKHRSGRRILRKPCSKRKISPLMICAKEGNTNMCNLLIEHHAKIDTRDNFGWTALFHACRNDQKDIAQLLIQNGADASDSINNYCPFNIAISSGAIQTLQVIVAEGADIRSISVPEEEEQCSALLLASEEQMTAVQAGMEFRHSYIDSILCNNCEDFVKHDDVRNCIFVYLGLVEETPYRERSNSF